MVNLELYRVFYTVAKCGSLTKAAEELYISQPAVSQSIKQLENQLGISLFNRTHRGMELSAQGGKMIFSKIEQALALFAEAETLVTQINTAATGAIRIGASETIFEYFLSLNCTINISFLIRKNLKVGTKILIGYIRIISKEKIFQFMN